MANAWSEGSWDESGFGGIETATVTLTGLEAATTLESVVTQTANNFGVTGVSANGEIGEEFALGNQVWGGGVWDGNIGWGGILNADVDVTGVESSGDYRTSNGISGEHQKGSGVLHERGGKVRSRDLSQQVQESRTS